MNRYERIALAWAAAEARLPEGWFVDKVERHAKGQLTIGPNIVQVDELWVAHARPITRHALDRVRWRRYRGTGNGPGYNGRGTSVVDALLDLAVRAEVGEDDQAPLQPKPRADAVASLFVSLFPEEAA